MNQESPLNRRRSTRLSTAQRPNSSGSKDANAKVSVQDVLESIRHGKKIIIGTFLAVTLIVAAVTWMTPAEYESHGIVYVNTQSNMQAAPFAMAGGIEDRGLHNELGILQYSYPLAERVAERIISASEQMDASERHILPILDPIEGSQPSATQVAWSLIGRTNFSLISNNMNMVRITATSSSPREAAFIANLYIEEYRQRSQETSRASISATRDFLEEQEHQRRTALQEVEKEYEDFMRNHGVVMLGSDGQNLVNQLSALDSQHQQYIIERNSIQTALTQLERQIDRVSPGLADRVASGTKARVQALSQQLGDLEVQIEAYYTRNPHLRGNESTVEDLRRLVVQRDRYRDELRATSEQLTAEFSAGTGLDPSEGSQALSQLAELNRQAIQKSIQLSEMDARIDGLSSHIGSLEPRLASIPAQSFQLAQLERERQAAARLHSYLLDELQRTVIAEESELGYVEIIRNAAIPRTPVRPKTTENMVLGMLLGLIFGIGFALVKRAMSQNIYKPEDVKDHGYSLVGIVPDMDRAVKAIFKNAKTVEMDGRQVSTKLLPIHDPWSSISESYRYVRTNIQFSRPDKVIQTLLITSANPGEGKTLTALNLALTVAQSGRRTLYVDADMRQPTGHTQLDRDLNPGFVQLIGSDDDEHSWEQFATGIENFYLLPAGRAVENPAEVLGSKALRTFVANLRTVFDVIIFDAPPILPVADSVLLSTQCDATLMVVAAGKTDVRAIDQAHGSLSTVGVHMLGVVLNKFDGKSGYGYGFGYGQGYGSRYGYGYGNRPAHVPSKTSSEKKTAAPPKA